MPSKKRGNNADSNQYQFKKDEKVLIIPKQHSDDIYEAKVLDRKIDSKSKEKLYKIHYKGWNKRWDEWVGSRRLLKINNTEHMAHAKQQYAQEYDEKEENDAHTKDDNKSNKNRKKRKIKHSTTNNKKRKLNDEIESESKKKKKKSAHNLLEVDMNYEIKRLLITDWENITKKALLIQLPRKSGERISDIMNDFESFAVKEGQDKNIVLEISRGIKDYFNQALKVTLLYKLERNQYNDISIKCKQLSMDKIYGVEHLCRLFVKLPQLLSPNELDNDTKQILKQQIELLLHFILQNKDKYFKSTSYLKL
eukprot:108232_1